MKKIIFILLVSLASVSVYAQLKDTRWKGALKGDNPQNVILDFRKDTFYVYTVADSSMVEIMTYSIGDKSFSIQKINGQSDCDNTVTGKYKFEIKNNNLF